MRWFLSELRYVEFVELNKIKHKRVDIRYPNMLSRAPMLCLWRLIFLSVSTGSEVQVRTDFFMDFMVSSGEYYMLSLLRDSTIISQLECLSVKDEPSACW